jgi:hypothetical protein
MGKSSRIPNVTTPARRRVSALSSKCQWFVIERKYAPCLHFHAPDLSRMDLWLGNLGSTWKLSVTLKGHAFYRLRKTPLTKGTATTVP